MPTAIFPSRTPVSAFVLICALVLPAVPALADSSPRAASGAPANSAKPAAIKKWPADPALRQGMGNVAGLLAGQWPAIRQAQLPGSAYLDLANTVAAQIAGSIKNRQLPPAAEGTFLAIQADMNRSVDLMRLPKPELQRVGALGLAQALRNYGKYFDHPELSVPEP
ncbi:MAG: hypothetical protein KJ787_05245 [Gammaproteobacteria bacterium]|nr:hypothetical protein [Gammaproteobacteria bacterium]MBU1645717.1 hypothetical protein [Gammaproteobacteria bacterium]MBU1971225.1 hypothetical protein [Gammaproteobacteria bacterium]